VVQRRKDEERKVFMKKVALALFVLAFTVPAMASVTITSALSDVNKVTIGYSTTGDEVRAFALNIVVSDKAFVVGSGKQVGDPNHINYWVYPGTMTFTVVDGNTVVDNFGNPLVEQDANGAVVEMASLYAASDPCHPSAPGTSGSLCYFYINKTPCGPDNKITVDVTLNTKRGSVVLKDPNVTPSVTLPVQLVYTCGAACWACVRQPKGDADGDGYVGALDVLKVKQSWQKSTGQAGYNCCADFDHDGYVGALDVLIIKQNWQTTGATCADISCP
jgi:hypothetical protein